MWHALLARDSRAGGPGDFRKLSHYRPTEYYEAVSNEILGWFPVALEGQRRARVCALQLTNALELIKPLVHARVRARITTGETGKGEDISIPSGGDFYATVWIPDQRTVLPAEMPVPHQVTIGGYPIDVAVAR